MQPHPQQLLLKSIWPKGQGGGSGEHWEGSWLFQVMFGSVTGETKVASLVDAPASARRLKPVCSVVRWSTIPAQLCVSRCR